MKSVVCRGTGDESVLQVEERPSPALPRDHLRLRVEAAGLNRADLLQRRGLYPPPSGVTDILGLECGGTVAEVHPGTTHPELGDRVMALMAGGGQAEEAVVDPGSVIPAPDHFDDVAAGAFPEVYLTAFFNLFQLAGLVNGMTALVHGGSGGVGTAAIQLVREAGARSVVTAGSDARCRRCLELGADWAVNYHQSDFEKTCKEVTDGRGIDVVLDCVGGPYLEKNLKVLKPEGRLVVIGLMGGTSAQLDMRHLLSRRLHVIGSTLRALGVRRKTQIVSCFLERFGAALFEGRLLPVIDSVYPVERVADAHRHLASGDVFGKVVLTFGHD
jgi:putative PIG3 family NAD(P)H quinone oxidoreductase